MAVDQFDLECMQLAVAEARKCSPEDSKPRPKVGVVVAKDNKVIATAYRGELGGGEHAEYTALERKLKDATLVGATVYTTLEPCTTRNHPKVPCAFRLIERKVARVFIGMTDPNEIISGRGQTALRAANIEFSVFPPALMTELEELNRDFIRAHPARVPPYVLDANLLARNQSRALNDWYVRVNAIFWDKNFVKTPSEIFAHLVEVVGIIGTIASGKRKTGAASSDVYIAKAIAWWLALAGKLGVKSVEQLIWDKFPGVCPYCRKEPHDNNVCSEMKRQDKGPQWQLLNEIGRERHQPHSLKEWQLMFSNIYPVQQTEDYPSTFARLSEELGELAEAIRIFPAEPGYFLSEAADVFAWLMKIQNISDYKNEVPRANRGDGLAHAFAATYPDSCKDCGYLRCTCPPILETTIGRIAHEVPAERGSFGEVGRFITVERARKLFNIK